MNLIPTNLKEKKAREIHILGLMEEKTNKRFSEDLEEKHMHTYALCSQDWFFYAYFFLFLFVCLFLLGGFVCLFVYGRAAQNAGS